MRTALAIALLALCCAAANADARGTYQEGVVSYSMSGSWTSTFTTSKESCSVTVAPGRTQLRDYTSTVTERGTFSSGRGTAHYQGKVGSEPFFLGNGDRPARLAVKVTRTISRSVVCAHPEPEDCGTRSIKGAVESSFDGSAPLTLRVHVADRPHDYDLTDPFKHCGADGLFLSSLNDPDTADYQDRALRYPTRASFWGRKRQTLAGTTKDRNVTFSMKLKTARRTLLSKRDLHP